MVFSMLNVKYLTFDTLDGNTLNIYFLLSFFFSFFFFSISFFPFSGEIFVIVGIGTVCFLIVSVTLTPLETI